MKRALLLALLVLLCGASSLRAQEQYTKETQLAYDPVTGLWHFLANGIDTVAGSGGGGGTPGGSSGQLQYNNSGAFGGFTLAGDCTITVPNITCPKNYQTVQNAGTPVTQEAALNFTGTAVASVVSAAGVTTVTLTAGAGGSGCTPPGTAGDLLYDGGSGACGDFSQLTVSGNVLTGGSSLTADFSGITLMKLRTKAGLTTSVNGDCGYDTTATSWHCWQNGADRYMIAATNLGTSGQPCLTNANGSCTFADPIVSGATAIGSAPSTNPVFTATWDGTNIRVPLTTNGTPSGSDYALEVRNIPSGTQTISGSVSLTGTLPAFAATPTVNAAESGTWTVQPGNTANTTPWLVTSEMQAWNGSSWQNATPWPADNSAFTAGTTGVGLIAGWYATSPTACTTGDLCAPSLTSDRKLFVQSFQGTSPWVDSVTTWGGGTLGAMANYGTSPGAVLVPGVNAYITNTPAVTGSGNFTVVQATGTNLHIVCDSGCSSSAGFADNSAFTVGTTAINPLGGLYDTGADPSISNGNAGRARIDSHSYLFSDLTAVAGTVLGSPSNYGTSPGAVEVLGVNAFITNTVNAAQSGTWTVQPGNTQNTTPWLMLPNDGTNSMGAMANFGASPSTAKSLNANAATLLSGTASAPTWQPLCDQYIIKNAFSTSGSTQIIAAPGSAKKTTICGFAVNGASATLNTVKLVYGTKTTNDCDTGAADLSVAVPIEAPASVAPAGQNVAPPQNALWQTTANQQVCANLSAAQSVNLQVWYKTD